mgnify:CR=1 FL=1
MSNKTEADKIAEAVQDAGKNLSPEEPIDKNNNDNENVPSTDSKGGFMDFLSGMGKSVNEMTSAAAGGLRRAGAGLTADAGDKEKVSNETNVVKDVTEQFKYDTGDNGKSNKIQQVPDKDNFKDAYTEEEIKLENDGKTCSIYVKKPTTDGNDYDLSYVKINKSILANAKLADGSKFFQRSGLLGVGEPGKKTKLHESWEKEQKYIQKVYDENPKYFSGATAKVGEDKTNLLDPVALAESAEEAAAEEAAAAEAAARVKKEEGESSLVSKTNVSPSPGVDKPGVDKPPLPISEESKKKEVVVEERQSESSGPGESEKTEVVVEEIQSDVQPPQSAEDVNPQSAEDRNPHSGAGKTRRRRKSRSKRRKGKTSKGRKSPKSKKRRHRKGKRQTRK